MAWTDPRTWSGGETLTAALLNTHLRDNLEAAFPVGSYLHILQAPTTIETVYAGAWLECNGVAVSRTTYSALNTLMSGLSYPFGSGDGSTTFNLPDCRGRALWNAGTHTNTGLGDNDGVAVASRQPKHQHTDNLGVSGGGAHTHPGVVTSVSTNSTIVDQSFNHVSVLTSATGTTGSTGSGGTSPSITGSVGSGMNGSDAVAHVVTGCWFIKALT